MSCCSKDDSCCGARRIFMFLALFAAGAVVVACLPEIKRYIKISNM